MTKEIKLKSTMGKFGKTRTIKSQRPFGQLMTGFMTTALGMVAISKTADLMKEI